MEGLIEKINSIIEKERILVNEPMAEHTTFKIGGNADVFVRIANEQELVKLITMLRAENEPYFVLGNGSNILVSDEGYRGVIIEVGSLFNEIRVHDDNRIVARSGALFSAVSHKAMECNLTGMEFASGIPGTVGGAVIMNAGAYGGEIKQVAYQVRALTPDGEIRNFSNGEMEFEYRNSRAKKEGFVILQVTFQLLYGDRDVIDGIMRDLNMKRRDKQPLEYPSAGSTFKRPKGNYAGKLIADAGLKGYRVGGAEVSKKHAGFLINADHATGNDMYRLIMDVQDKVLKSSGVKLEPEVIFLGEFK